MSERNNFIPGDFYGSVEDASAPYSSNTETFICVRDCSGGTASFVSVPHATYTNAQGKAVVQLDTVVLGGPNGLNA